MSRALLFDFAMDTAGNVLTSKTLTLYKPGTFTLISSTMYTDKSGAATVTGSQGDNATKTLISDSKGQVFCWFDPGGADVPGPVRVYSAADNIDRVVMVSFPGDGVQAPAEYIIRSDGTTIWAEPQKPGLAVFSSTTDIGTVISQAATAISATGGKIYIMAGSYSMTLAGGVTVPTGVRIEGPGSPQFGTPTVGAVIGAASGIGSTNYMFTMSQESSIGGLQLNAATSAAGCIKTAGSAVRIGPLMKCTGGTDICVNVANGSGQFCIWGENIFKGGANVTLQTNGGVGGGASSSDGSVKDCRIVNDTGTAPGTAVLHLRAAQAEYSNLHITGGQSTGPPLLLTGKNELVFTNCYFDGGPTPEVLIKPEAGDNLATAVRFVGCKFLNFAAAPLNEAVHLDATNAAIHNISFEHCEFGAVQGGGSMVSAYRVLAGTPTHIKFHECWGTNLAALFTNEPTFYDGFGWSTNIADSTKYYRTDWDIVKTANTTKVNNTLANDADLLFRVPANEMYFFKLFLKLSAAGVNTQDSQFAWSLPAGATVEWAPVASEASATGPDFRQYATATVPTAISTGTITNGVLVGTSALYLAGWISTGATAGTANFQWAQASTDAANALTLQKGSRLQARRAIGL